MILAFVGPIIARRMGVRNRLQVCCFHRRLSDHGTTEIVPGDGLPWRQPAASAWLCREIMLAALVGASGDKWIGVHCNGIHTYQEEWTAVECIVIQCIGIHCVPLGTGPRPGAVPGKTQRGAGGFHYNPVNATNHPEVGTMPSCIACGAQLEPPVRVPHAVYVKSLYRIAGQDYCRHHIIRAAVAAGVIAEIRAGAAPVVAIPRE